VNPTFLNCVIEFLRLRHQRRPAFQVGIIAWMRMLLEKAIVALIIKKFLLFYGNRMFIFVFRIMCITQTNKIVIAFTSASTFPMRLNCCECITI
jgi:hypothetical protein